MESFKKEKKDVTNDIAKHFKKIKEEFDKYQGEKSFSRFLKDRGFRVVRFDFTQLLKMYPVKKEIVRKREGIDDIFDQFKLTYYEREGNYYYVNGQSRLGDSPVACNAKDNVEQNVVMNEILFSQICNLVQENLVFKDYLEQRMIPDYTYRPMLDMMLYFEKNGFFYFKGKKYYEMENKFLFSNIDVKVPAHSVKLTSIMIKTIGIQCDKNDKVVKQVIEYFLSLGGSMLNRMVWFGQSRFQFLASVLRAEKGLPFFFFDSYYIKKKGYIERALSTDTGEMISKQEVYDFFLKFEPSLLYVLRDEETPDILRCIGEKSKMEKFFVFQKEGLIVDARITYNLFSQWCMGDMILTFNINCTNKIQGYLECYLKGGVIKTFDIQRKMFFSIKDVYSQITICLVAKEWVNVEYSLQVWYATSLKFQEDQAEVMNFDLKNYDHSLVEPEIFRYEFFQMNLVNSPLLCSYLRDKFKCQFIRYQDTTILEYRGCSMRARIIYQEIVAVVAYSYGRKSHCENTYSIILKCDVNSNRENLPLFKHYVKKDGNELIYKVSM